MVLYSVKGSGTGGDSITLCEAVCDVRFWLLGLAKFCGM